MKKELSLIECKQLILTLNRLSSEKGKVFSFYINRNMSNIESIKNEIIEVEKLLEPTEEFKKYDMERVEICEQHAKKDEDGKPIIEAERYVFKDAGAVDKHLIDHNVKYESVILEYGKAQKEYVSLLNEKKEIEISAIPFDVIPDHLNYLEIEILVKESPEEIEKILTD